jgi:hypothetical protein
VNVGERVHLCVRVCARGRPGTRKLWREVALSDVIELCGTMCDACCSPTDVATSQNIMWTCVVCIVSILMYCNILLIISEQVIVFLYYISYNCIISDISCTISHRIMYYFILGYVPE